MDRPTKRLKTEPDTSPPDAPSASSPLPSLSKSITPPPSRPQQQSTPAHAIPSPFQLTKIFAQSSLSGNNEDTVRLDDILGDPLIRECWQFNYMIDVDFVMSQFDADVRGLVKVKIVHGSWKREDGSRAAIEEACSRYPNVEPVIAYMPEPFGTHHSKMMVLLRHDDLAQIVIHTANMIPFDWKNMCQAVWRSPLLPLQQSTDHPGPGDVGSGARFKRDLLAYLNAYGRGKTGSLVRQLSQYDFGAVRAALVASVPSRQRANQTDSQRETAWGWPGLKDTLRRVPTSRDKKPHVVVQVSSIASLGQTPKWLHDVFFDSLAAAAGTRVEPKYSIVFPTPDEIRYSINGYLSGLSIHMKLQSAAQQKQLHYMRPYLCQWAGDIETRAGGHRRPAVGDWTADGTSSLPSKRDAGRRRMAPHIKTYTRFSDAETMDTIDWAMVTSANLSTQAWGATPNASGEVRISSWEIGVVVWPGLFDAETMVPCFKRDLPAPETRETQTLVGLRMPYDLPLTPYSADDVPWCATTEHEEPDQHGMPWGLSIL